MREVPGSNPIGKIAFFIDKICPTVTLVPTFFLFEEGDIFDALKAMYEIK